MPGSSIAERSRSDAHPSGERAGWARAGEAGAGAHELLSTLHRKISLVRVAFGLVWAIDAWYKWQPAFQKQFLATITRAGRNAPAVLQPWFRSWGQAITPHAVLFGLMTAAAETAIAAALMLGIARRPLYLAGAMFSFLIWAVPESFGRIWQAGQTDIGTSIMYVFIFLALFALDNSASTGGWSLDRWLAARIPAWRPIADL